MNSSPGSVLSHQPNALAHRIHIQTHPMTGLSPNALLSCWPLNTRCFLPVANPFNPRVCLWLGKRSLVFLSKVAFSRKTFLDGHQLITILSVLLKILGENVYLRIRLFVLLRQLPLGSLCTGRTSSREGVLRFSG